MVSVGWPYLSMLFYDKEGFRKKWTDEQILDFMRTFPGTISIIPITDRVYRLKLKNFTLSLDFEMQDALFTESLIGQDFPCFEIGFNGIYFNLLENEPSPPKKTPPQGVVFAQLFLHLAQCFDCDYGGIAMEGGLSTPVEIINGISDSAFNFFINTKSLESNGWEQLIYSPGVTSKKIGHILYLSTYNMYFPSKASINNTNWEHRQQFTTQLERLIRRNYRPILLP